MRRRVLGVALAAFAVVPVAEAREVGVAAAVNPDAVGTPPGEAERVIRVGLDMLRDERVATGPQGRTQMLFLDGSALTIGPDSEVILDEFVFDPESGAGKLALTASKGLFRFVGGKISKQQPVTIRTPTATIGVRGGIAVVEVGAQTRAQFLFGDQMTVAAGGQVREVTRPGFEVTAAPNSAPSAPAPLSQQGVASNMGGLEGVQGSTGGARQQPTDENVADTQITQLSSNRPPQRVAPERRGGGRDPSSGPSPTQASEREQAQINQLVTTEQAVNEATGQTRSEITAGLSSPFTYGGHVYTSTPFLGFTFDPLGATRDPEHNFAYAQARVQNGFFVGLLDDELVRLPARPGSFSFSASGTETGIGPIEGKGFFAPDLSFFAYVGRSVEDNGPGFVFGGVPFDPPPAPTGFATYALKPGFPGGDHIPFLPFETGGNFGGASISPLYARFFEPNTPPSPAARMVALYGAIALEGQGPGQRSAMTTYTGTFFEDPGLGKDVLTGFAEGSVRLGATGLPIRIGQGGTSSPDAAGNSFFGLFDRDYFVLDSDTYPVGMPTPRQSSAGFVQAFENTAMANPFFQTQVALRDSPPPGLGASRNSRTLNGYVGAVADVRTGFANGVPQFDIANYANSGSSPTAVQITTDPLTNRAAASFALDEASASFPPTVLQFGGLSGPGARSAFIDDRIFGMRDSASAPSTLNGQSANINAGLLTSAFFTNQSAVPAGVTLCTCEHLTWGFFSADIRDPNGPLRARFHLAPFVAGELPTPGELPASGAATYSGHVTANVLNAGARYVAFGAFTQSWDFGQRMGSVSIANLDGANYSGSIGSGDGREFSGSLGGAGRFGALNGSFFRGGGDPAGAAGGTFYVEAMSGPAYEVGGIFVARKQ